MEDPDDLDLNKALRDALKLVLITIAVVVTFIGLVLYVLSLTNWRP